MTKTELDALCQEWAAWCYARRNHLKPSEQPLLAKLHPSKAGRALNTANSAHMPHFNRAVHALAGMPEHAPELACFRLLYIEEASHIKRQADILGISRPTYYHRARAFARMAWALSQQIRNTYQSDLADIDEQVTG